MKKNLYFRVSKLLADPLYIPLFISDDDLKHMPPCVTFGCEHDVLKNDAQIFHNRLRNVFIFVELCLSFVSLNYDEIAYYFIETKPI